MRLKKKATVARRIRCMHSPEFKARIALEALRETRTMTELCQEHDLHANQIIDWKRQLIEGATGVFGAPHQWPKPWTPASSFFGAESGEAGWIALGQYLRGWTAYFGISQHYRSVPELDEWIRRRIRMCYWKQWRWVRTKIKHLLALG